MNIYTSKIDYQVGEQRYQGYLAYDDSITRPRPAVMVVHEWWGVNDYVMQRAHQLAELGYVALAIDMYGEGKVAADPLQAGALMNAVLADMETATLALRAGYETLLALPQVDADKTAAIGYCFGGAMVLHMARIGMPLQAVVSFHGALGSFHQAQPGGIKAQILVCHGGADSMVTMDALADFKNEMDAVGAIYQVKVYDGAKHGFSSRQADINGQKYQLDLAYNAEADTASWAEMQELLQQVFEA